MHNHKSEMERKVDIGKEEKFVLSAVAAALADERQRDKSIFEGIDWYRAYEIAKSQAVIALIYEELLQTYLLDKNVNTINMPENIEKQWEIKSRQTVQQSYRLLFLTRYLVRNLEAAGIKVVVLKGAGIAACYPVPELRKSGDIDLLLVDKNQVDKADKVLKQLGIRKNKNQLANHHIVYDIEDNIELELHTTFAEPFTDKYTNNYMEKVYEHIKNHMTECEVMEVQLPVMSDGYQAFQLLLHMLQHFLREGFGIKLLADWVVFWNHGVSETEKRIYIKHIENCGLSKFSEMVTGICYHYLGLQDCGIKYAPKQNCEIFLREILEAGEFGRNDNERMVIMRRSGIVGLTEEFHHQMKLNFPEGSKIFILWPVLWILTFIKFMKNNKRLNRPSVFKMLKKADKRSRMVKELRLFDRKARE